MGAVRLVLTRYAAALSLPPHVHSRPSIALGLGGRLEERFGNVRHCCDSLDVILKPAWTEHTNRTGRDGAGILMVEFGAAMQHRLDPFARFDVRRVRVAGGLAAAQALRMLVLLESDDDVAVPLAEELALELMATLSERLEYRGTGAAPKWLQRVREAMHDAPASPHTLTGLAADAGVHPVHLARAFRHHYGRPLGRYLRRIRVGLAADRLAWSDESAARLAGPSGFCDQSHLNRVFRRETGWTPGHYRRAVRALAPVDPDDGR